MMWNEIPTFKTLIGASLVIMSSLVILRREIYYKQKIPSNIRHD